jgi:hypothetical protein
MNAIYTSAVLAIVEASGDHADAGLHGISIPRVHEQRSEMIRGFRLAVKFPS